MKYRLLSVLMVTLLLLVGCAGLNPNPGERTADMANESGDYSRAVSIVKPAAERGEPWAQLRLGVYYEKGIAVEKDIKQSAYWYSKCAMQKGEGGWADGVLVGSAGRSGYFNQNADSLIAQWRLADLLLAGNGIDRDPFKAYLLSNNVVKESKGRSLFYCCEWLKGGGFYITPAMVTKTRDDALTSLSPDQRTEAQAISEKWTPKAGL